MNRTAHVLGVLAILAGATAADEPKTKKINDGGAPDALIGAYTIVAGERFGEKLPADRVEGTMVRIAKDGIVVLDKEKKEVYAQTYALDTSKIPWSITMTSKITPFTQGKEEHVAKGLMKQDGDTVRLIYALPGGETPTEFKTKEKQLMFELKKQKK